MTVDVESFRVRARQWLAATMPRLAPGDEGILTEISDDKWPRARELQRLLWDGGFAGICYPLEYGGLGLTPAHQRAFNDECADYEMPLVLNIPTFSICAPVVLDMGSEEQKRQHLPAVLRGDEVMVQFLSEPRGGSHLGRVTTPATRRGRQFMLHGSKSCRCRAYTPGTGP